MSDIVPQKRCIKCNNLYPATTDYFYRNQTRLERQCKACKSDYMKARRLQPDTRERMLNTAREYKKRPEVQAHRQEYQKDYYLRPGVKERYKAYHQSYNPEYNSRPGVRAKLRFHWIKKYTRRSAVKGDYTAQQIRDLLKRQKHRCYYCSKKFEKRDGAYIYQIEHTYPLSRVTSDIPANDISYIVLACPKCNQSKRDKFPWEWPEGGHLL